MEEDAMPEILGEYIDRLVTIEMKNRGMLYGTIHKLYEAARKEAGRRPLSTLAGEGLVKNVQKGDAVVIVTGAGAPPGLPNGESDGPPGAALLARVLYRGIGALPIYVCEEHHAPPLVASSEAAGVMIKDYSALKEKPLGGMLMTSPTKDEEVAAWAASLFDRYNPKAIIGTERLGPNEKGVIHGATGLAGFKPQVDLTPLFTEAEKRGVFSIGVGDHGNEIGFGRIHSQVKEIMPYGGRCQCPCGAGNATVVKTDVLFPAFISNWGCYAIEAMVAFLLKQPNLSHTPEMERDVVIACLQSGGLEAMWCTKLFYVDGARAECGMAVADLLREMVQLALAEPDRGTAH
jgi:hypothetical protein